MALIGNSIALIGEIMVPARSQSPTLPNSAFHVTREIMFMVGLRLLLVFVHVQNIIVGVRLDDNVFSDTLST